MRVSLNGQHELCVDLPARPAVLTALTTHRGCEADGRVPASAAAKVARSVFLSATHLSHQLFAAAVPPAFEAQPSGQTNGDPEPAAHRTPFTSGR